MTHKASHGTLLQSFYRLSACLPSIEQLETVFLIAMRFSELHSEALPELFILPLSILNCTQDNPRHSSFFLTNLYTIA